MSHIETCHHSAWDEVISEKSSDAWVHTLESGGVLFFPKLPFPLAEKEKIQLSNQSLRKRKNISFNPTTQQLGGYRSQNRQPCLTITLVSLRKKHTRLSQFCTEALSDTIRNRQNQFSSF